jgi:hypothetical protein
VLCSGVEHLDPAWVTPTTRSDVDAALPKARAARAQLLALHAFCVRVTPLTARPPACLGATQGERYTFRTRTVTLLSGARCRVTCARGSARARCSPHTRFRVLALTTPAHLLPPRVRAAGCTLAPGERRSFHIQFTLPHALPPSFRGTFARCVPNASTRHAFFPGVRIVQTCLRRARACERLAFI